MWGWGMSGFRGIGGILCALTVVEIAVLGVWSQGVVVHYVTTSGGTSYGTDSSRQRHDD